jgi:ribonuclease HI
MECYLWAHDSFLNAQLMVCNAVLAGAPVPSDWGMSRIQLLYKGKGDPLDPNNYRPIALLNSNYKLLAKTLTYRTMAMLEKLSMISNAQGGWRSGRSCTDKINALLSVLKHAKNNNAPLHLLYIDQKKAYDSLDHDVLFEVMRRRGFDARYISFLRRTYAVGQACVSTPYGDTEYFRITRGVRQGCSLSCLLYICFLDPALLYLQGIGEGYKISNTCSFKASGFADDIVMASRSHADISVLWETFKKFARLQGIAVSNSTKEKTVYSHNQGNNPLFVLYDLDGLVLPSLASEESYTYLGVKLNLQCDWKDQTTALTAKLCGYTGFLRRSAFNDEQCVSIINRVFLPSILYRARVIPFPQQILREWDAKIAALIFHKMGLPKNSGRDYLYQQRNQNGKGLNSLEILAPAEYLAHGMSSGLNSNDELTKQLFHELESNDILARLGKLNADNVRAGGDAQFSLKFNKYAVLQHRSNRLWEELRNGAVPGGNRQQTQDALTVNGMTFRPDILADFPEPEWLTQPSLIGPLDEFAPWEAWTDGSFASETGQGGAAVIFPGNEPILAPMAKCASSLEPELNAIYYALWATPVSKSLKLYTDSLSSIHACERQMLNPGRNVKNTRTRWLLRHIVLVLEARADAGADTEFKHVYSHLLDNDNPEDEVVATKLNKMREIYGDDTMRILAGNQTADVAAKQALDVISGLGDDAHTVTSGLAPGAQRDLYELSLRGKEVHDALPSLLAQSSLENRLHSHEQAHPHIYDWQSNSDLCRRSSFLCLSDKTSCHKNLRTLLWKARNNKLNTRGHLYPRLAQAQASGSQSSYTEHLRKHFHCNVCPFGCEEVEDMEHILTCPHTSHLRKQANIELTKLMREERVSQNLIDQTAHWLQTTDGLVRERNMESMSDKEYGLAYIPQEFAVKLQEEAPTRALNIILNMQYLIAQALLDSWKLRCSRLYDRSRVALESLPPVPQAAAVPVTRATVRVAAAPSIASQSRICPPRNAVWKSRRARGTASEQAAASRTTPATSHRAWAPEAQAVISDLRALIIPLRQMQVPHSIGLTLPSPASGT